MVVLYTDLDNGFNAYTLNSYLVRYYAFFSVISVYYCLKWEL